jgi:hypothetical protein
VGGEEARIAERRERGVVERGRAQKIRDAEGEVVEHPLGD